MASRYFGKANVGGNWSTVGNWWANSARTVAAGAIPTAADLVYFDGQSGNCLLDVNGISLSLDFGGFGAGGDTFDFNGNSLSFRDDCFLNALVSVSAIDMSTAGSVLRYDGTVGDGDLYAFGSIMTLAEVELYNPTASFRRLNAHNGHTIAELAYYTTSTGAVQFYSFSGRQIIRDISTQGTGHNSINSPSSAASDRTTFVGEARLNLLEAMVGYFSFGFSEDVNIYLNSSLSFLYGTTWYIYSLTTSDITVTFYTPGGQGSLYLSSGINVEAASTGNITVDFSNATMKVTSSHATWPAFFNTSRVSMDAEIYIDWGTSNTFSVQDQFGFSYVSNFSGNDCEFLIRGSLIMNYVAPDWDPEISWPELPGTLRFFTYSTSTHSAFIHNNAIIGGGLVCIQDSGVLNLTHTSVGTEQRIKGDFLWNKSSAALSSHNYLGSVIYEGDFTIQNSTTSNHTEDWNDESIDVYGSVVVDNYVVATQTATGQLHMHIPKSGDRYFGGGAHFDNFAGTVIFDHDDGTDEGGSYDLWIDLPAADVLFAVASFRNIANQTWGVEFTPHASRQLAFGKLLHTAASEPPADPCDAGNSPVTRFKSRSPGSQWHVAIQDSGTDDLEYVEFTDCANDGGYFGTTASILVRDGTAIDGGNNTGNFLWTYTAGSIAICPSDTIELTVYRYAQIPAAQFKNILNIDGGTLAPSVTFGSVPAWLDVTEVVVVGQRKVKMELNTTDLVAGVYSESFTIAAAGALRSPATVNIELTVLDGVVPVATPDDIDFYVLRDRTYPEPVDVSVVNPYTAETMAEIEVYGVPAWLDVEINPPGSSSSSSSSSSLSSLSSEAPFSNSQSFRISVNEIGEQLARGTYTAQIGVTAANADSDWIIDVELVVEALLISADPSTVEFTMIEQTLPLPDPQAVQLGNIGDGTLESVVVSSPVTWLTTTVSGSGNLQFLEIAVNSGALSLTSGDYEVTLQSVSDADDEATVTVRLSIQARRFALQPDSVEFAPTPRWEISDVKHVRAIAVDYAINAAVEISGVPNWLDVQVDASELNDQIITLSIIQALFDQIEDPAEYNQTLFVTATGNPASATLPLSVSVRSPAFFRRPDCDMDFVPRIEGTLVEVCDVPPPVPPRPQLAVAPALPPLTGGGGYPLNARITAGPCLACTIEIVYDGELGYLGPEIVIECTEHGCSEEGLEEGWHCGSDDESGLFVRGIELDACGHVCDIVCDSGAG